MTFYRPPPPCFFPLRLAAEVPYPPEDVRMLCNEPINHDEVVGPYEDDMPRDILDIG
jgi:hypothetical protein